MVLDDIEDCIAASERRGSSVDHDRVAAGDGTGFGIAVVRSVVATHGWTVGVAESEDGRGLKRGLSRARRE